MASSFPRAHSETEMENQSSPAATSPGASSFITEHPNSSSSKCAKYDVFINHRGAEVKKTFASHLYRKLLSCGLRPFLDQHELQEGNSFTSQLQAAIQSASVHVAIFSPKYAESQWCLDELHLMLESRAPIIPIFYNVSPADLRLTDQSKNGVYAKALDQLQTKKTVDSETDQEKPIYNSGTIQKWRNALSSVADISGFDLKGVFNSDEDQMLQRLVEHVVKLVAKNAKYPTGLDEKLKEFEAAVSRQQHSGKVQVVGIVGLGGSGKTTLAREFFNRKKLKYAKSYFLSEVGANTNKTSVHSSLSDLLKGHNIEAGIKKLKWDLKASCVLLVLDDIGHENQLEAILPIKDVLSFDSLILVTSRHRDVLVRSGVDTLSIYNLSGLTPQHSRELFCSYAFCQAYPLQGFEDLVDSFTKVCQGLPLSLRVLGAHLFGRDNKSDWEEILHQVKVPADLQKILKTSYDALSEEEQQFFLDIVFFFIGANKNSAITVWDGSGWNGSLGFRNLQHKCLVEVDSENAIHMHDHLQDLGKEIAKDVLPRRLWHSTDNNVDDLLQQDSSGVTEVRGIKMFPDTDSDHEKLAWYQRRSKELFGNLLLKLHTRLHNFLGTDVMKLQLLDTKGHLLERILRRLHSPNLKWLYWRDCPYPYLPSWIPMKNLRVLKVQGTELKTLWQGESQAPLQLRELEIIDAFHLSYIPKSIEQLKHLERMVIWFSSLDKLPDEIGHLKLLRVLVVRGCSFKLLSCSMKLLPGSIGNLANLEHIDLSWCNKLKSLPDSFGNLGNLQHMTLSWCRELERLPDSIGNLVSLQHMNLSWCEKLERLPDSFGNLLNLQDVDLSGCEELERLPDSFGNLVNLQHIYMSACQKLETLPDSCGNLVNLQHLDLQGCGKLERLPDSFGNLGSLRHMNLSGCQKLKKLPDSFGNLMNLQEISMYKCQKLEKLPGSFGRLSSLESFKASGCSNLTISSDTLGNIRTLKHIDLSDCEKIEVWSSRLAHQRSLKILKLSGTNFKELPSAIGVLRDLEVLWIGSPFLDTLPSSLGDLRNLKELTLKGCRELKHLPASVGLLNQLTSLEVTGCSAVELPFKMVKQQKETVGTSNFDHSTDKYMPSIQRLILRDTEITEVSFAEDVCPNLQRFNLYGCRNLVKVGTLPSTLVEVELIYCSNLRNTDGLCGLGKLRTLKIEECDELQELPCTKTLLSLMYLTVTNCEKLKAIRDLAQLTELQFLDVARCQELEELEGVEYCASLMYLDNSWCPNLQWGEGVEETLRQRKIII